MSFPRECCRFWLMLTPGQARDLRAAPFLLEGLKCRDVVRDRGYDADALCT